MNKLQSLIKFSFLKKYQPFSKEYFDDYIAYVKAIWRRIIKWREYPQEYLRLHENQGNVTFLHMKDNVVIEKEEFLITDTGWKKYIVHHSHLPICLSLQGHSLDLVQLPTSKLYFWERFTLFQNLRRQDFNEDDLVNHYQAKTIAGATNTDVVVALRSGSTLKNFYKKLASLPNPFMGVQTWEFEINAIMKKQAAFSHPLRSWVISLIPLDGKQMTLMVSYKDILTLQRHVYCIAPADLEKEITATLKYLERQGYKENDAVSVLIPTAYSKFITTKQSKVEFIAMSNELFKQENAKAKKPLMNFVPRALKESYFAYVLPQMSIKYLIPFSIACILLWGGTQVKAFFQGHENQFAVAQYEKILKSAPTNIPERLHYYKLFQNYVAVNHANPSSKISKVNRMLRAKIPATFISWDVKEQNNTKNFELRLKFPLLEKRKLYELRRSIEQQRAITLEGANVSWDENSNETILCIQGNSTNEY